MPSFLREGRPLTLVCAGDRSGLKLRGIAQPALAVAIPFRYRKAAVVESVRACLSGPFPDFFVSESPADCPPLLTLAVLVDGWGELGLLHALRRFREISIAALAISTAVESDLADLLEAGWVDAVRWPVTPRELIARVGLRLPSRSATSDPFNVQLDAAYRLLTCHDLTIPLTRSQFALLRVLIQRPGEWVSSRGLMNTALRSKQEDTARLRVRSTDYAKSFSTSPGACKATVSSVTDSMCQTHMNW